MVNYKNSKIYEIISKNTDKKYIGSTCSILSKRLLDHVSCHKTNVKRNATSHIIIQAEDYEIKLIESFPCNTKEELHSRERYYIELYKDVCVNKTVPQRTRIERYANNVNGEKDKIKVLSKKYREKNRDKVLAKKREYHNKNKDKISDQKKEKMTCACGVSFRKADIQRHKKSARHHNFINK